MVKARGIMTMRAVVERNTTPYFGQPNTVSTWVVLHTALPCMIAYQGDGETRLVFDNRLPITAHIAVMVPIDTDIKTSDKIVDIQDRRGVSHVPRPLWVRGVQYRYGYYLLQTEEVAS